MICVCYNCGKEFESNRKSKKYCSDSCRKVGNVKSHRKYSYDVDNPQKCMFCEKILSYDQVKRNNKFCSSKCFYEYNNKIKQDELNNVEQKCCEVCGNALSVKQIKNGQRTCSCSCGAKLRYTLYGPHKLSYEHKEKLFSGLSNLLKSDEYRNIVSNRMKNNNPLKNPDTIKKALKTRERNGNLHRWCGERGGNGKMSKCEQMLFSTLSSLGFKYNAPIRLNEMRVKYPDKNYPTNYKPDFTNFDKMLCVEIDGKSHNSKYQKNIDAKKEECLNILGYRVIRFSNDVVLSNFDLVVDTIIEKLSG